MELRKNKQIKIYSFPFIYLPLTLTMVEVLLVLPLELEGVHLYSPMSLVVTLDIVNVESVSPEIMTPFFIH